MSQNMTRLEAAEFAVVEAALDGDRFVYDQRRASEITAAWLQNLREACARLRDLRANLEQPTCGVRGHVLINDEAPGVWVPCARSPGHDGDHEAAVWVRGWS